MPPASPLTSHIASLLGRGGTVVTGNQRAARSLRLDYDRQCRSGGLPSWRPPAVFAWDTWTAGLYRHLLLSGRASRMLLNRTQELQVWRSVIESDRREDKGKWASLQGPDSLAAMAADAWQLLCAYRGQQRLKNLGVSEDTRNFQRWAQAFVRRSDSDAYLTAAELEEALIASASLFSPAAELVLVGFDVKTPAQQALIHALRDSGTRIEDGPVPLAAAGLQLAATETPGEELSQAALWIRGFLTTSPRATVAVIVPGLEAERREIDRVFRHLLAPELEDITSTAAACPYEFSLGLPLAGASMVAVALEILRFATAALPLTNISRLLLSPYFGVDQNELSARAEFDAFELRTLPSLRPEITLARLVSLVRYGKRGASLSNLLGQLRSLERTAAQELSGPGPKQRQWSVWADLVRELLEDSGWPGSAPLDSVEFQTRQKFDAALDELATLDFEGTRPTFAEALAQFEAVLERTLFAPESRDAPVQIMSPLEAAGSRFDALWFLRASDLDWPVRPALNPLLGWRLQRELAMPASDAALDSAYAQRVTGRAAASSDTVVFSYAMQTEERRQRPSPTLAGFGLAPLAPLQTAPASAATELESIADDAFVPLTTFAVPGGASVLQLQAACGFRAFAEARLWSTPIETAEPGMDLRERGNIVHLALEHLWSELGTQAALRALTDEGRSAQLGRSIEHSLERALAQLAADSSASAWDDAYLDLQRRRLHNLLAPWLRKELERPPFEVVQREERGAVAIGPLALKIRIDRIDRLLDEAGGSVLIDYKTGPAKPSDWAGDRPDGPQLPLYAVLHRPESLAAVAFANIRAGKELALKGFAGRGGVLEKSDLKFDTLEEQLKDWRRVLTALAEDFANGDARVRPKDYPTTCKHCAQRLFCRLDPASLIAGDEDAEASEEADA